MSEPSSNERDAQSAEQTPPTGKTKKPFYKRTWVIAVVTFLLGIAVGGGGSETTEAASGDSRGVSQSDVRRAEDAARTAEERASDLKDQLAAATAELDTLTAQQSAAETQSEATSPEPTPTPTTPKPKPEPEQPELSAAQEQALGSAESYLDFSAFSRSGLIDQLKFEGFSNKDATLAVDSLKIDYNQQAAKSAKDYLDTSNFSRSGLIEQLQFEGFTQQQATFGVNQTGL